MIFVGTTGRDSYVGTALTDDFDMSQGGRDTVEGLDGDDFITFGAEFNANDRIDGGDGTDYLILEGNYLAGVVFTATTAVNIEHITVHAGFNYSLTLDDATATGLSFTMDGFLLGPGDSLVFDGSAETTTTLNVTGGEGADLLIGGQAVNNWRLEGGGSDTVTGQGGADIFYVGGFLDATDSLAGGAGFDRLEVRGTYAGLTITAAMISGTERMNVSALFDTNLALADDFVDAGLTYAIDVATINVFSVNDIVIDGSAETDAAFDFTGGVSNDTFRGGALGDTIDFQTAANNDQGAVDVAEGNGGDDVILFDHQFTRDDQVDGGDGSDTLELEGDYSAGVNFGAATMSDVEQIVVEAGFDYVLTVGDNNVTADGFTVDATALLTGESLSYDASAESASDLILLGGDGADILTAGGGDDSILGRGAADSLVGGAGDDTINGQLGRDTIFGGEGTDRLRGGEHATTFVFAGVAESTGPGRDWVDVIKPQKDELDLDVVVTGVDPRVNAGTMSEATFDFALGAEIGAAELAAGHAVVFKPSAGDLAGHFFLIVDANGVAGYQGGEDYVFEFAAGSHPNAIAVGMFV